MIQRIDNVKTSELPPISPRSSYHSATTQPSTPNSLDDLSEISAHNLEGVGVSFGEEEAVRTPSQFIPDHLIPDAASRGSHKDVLHSPRSSKRSSFGGKTNPPENLGKGSDAELDERKGGHTREPSRVSSYGDADDGEFSDEEEEMAPYTLSGISHSLGGMAMIIYVILKRIEGKPHR